METVWLTIAELLSGFTLRVPLLILATVVLVFFYWPLLRALFRLALHHFGLVLIGGLLYGFIYQGLGEEYGVPALFWNEVYFHQLLAGLASTTLIGVLLVLVFYGEAVGWNSEADPDDPRHIWTALERLQGWAWCWRWIEAPSLRNSNFYRLCVFLAIVGLPCFVYLAIPAVTAAGMGGPLIHGEIGVTRLALAWLPGIGLGVAFLIVILLVSIVVFDWMVVPLFFRALRPADANTDDPNSDDVLSASITTAGVLIVLSYVTLAVPPAYGIVRPAVAICALLGLVGLACSVLGFMILGSTRAIRPFGVSRSRLWIGVLAALLAVSGVVANHRPYLYHFPNMSYAPADRAKLMQRFAREANLDGTPARTTMLNDQAALDAWRGDASQPKRTLAVVAVSGGGIRAAVWTAVALRKLEETIEDFSYHVRLVTGASGGMVGAALFVQTVDPPGRNPNGAPHAPGMFSKVVETSAHDGLTNVAKQLVLRDLPRSFVPFELGPVADRGTELERAWAGGSAQETGPRLDVPQTSLVDGERAGWRPSLVFSPMLAQDGRRLIVSNVDLKGLIRTEANILKQTKDNSKGDPIIRRLIAIPAIQFFEYFPNQTGLELGTAVRMSASFPLVSPAVNLPTVPPRTPIDAGYYDNFGVNLAAAWIYEHREWLSANTANVVLIQIRDSASEFRRRQVSDPDGVLAPADKPPGSWSFWSLFDVPAATTPVKGLLSAKSAAMSFRNDQQIEIISDWFGKAGGAGFATTVFENPSPAALSWYLTHDEQMLIEGGMDWPANVDDEDLWSVEEDGLEARSRNVMRMRLLRKIWKPPLHSTERPGRRG